MTKRTQLKRKKTCTGKLCSVCAQKSALIACSCSSPSTLLCGPCSTRHSSAEGHHLTSLRPFKLESSETTSQHSSTSSEASVCSLCSESGAEMVCCCDFPPPLVCKECISEHLTREPLGMHAPLPVELRENVTSPAYITSLRHRYMGKCYASQLLSANLAQIVEGECARSLADCKPCERNGQKDQRVT